MEGIEVDEIAVFRCAIRSGYNVRKPSDVTDKMKVEMARKKSLDVARYILKECYWLTYDDDEKDDDQHPFVQLLHELAFGLIPASNLQDWEWINHLPEGISLVERYSQKLGKDKAEYLTHCFTKANAGYVKYIIDPDAMCLDDNEIPDWLGQAFNLRQVKGAGQPIELELGADILDGITPIFEELQKNSDHFPTALEEHLQKIKSGESSQLPLCIERLIRLRGYPQAEKYLPDIRKNLAHDVIPEEIEQARQYKSCKNEDERNRMAAANIFMKCSDKCVDQVEKLLERSDVSSADKDRLRDKREILRDYGSESLQSHNKSGNAAGLERLFRDRKKSIHSQIKRSPNVRSVEELEDILDDMAMQRKKRKARSDPTVRKAIQIIKLPDVGNNKRTELRKLQKQTPEEHQHIWPELWEEFMERALANARAHDKSGDSW